MVTTGVTKHAVMLMDLRSSWPRLTFCQSTMKDALLTILQGCKDSDARADEAEDGALATGNRSDSADVPYSQTSGAEVTSCSTVAALRDTSWTILREHGKQSVKKLGKCKKVFKNKAQKNY